MTTINQSAANNTGAVGSVGNIGNKRVVPVVTPVAVATAAVNATAAAPLKAAKGFRLQLQQLLAGVQAVLPDGGALVASAAQPVSKADMVQTLTSAMAAYTAVDALLTSIKQARQQLKSGLPASRAYFDTLRTALENYFGKSSPVLEQFGLKPLKTTKARSSVSNVAAAAKAQQTRALRHTMSAKKKAALQFTGQVAVSTQVSAPAAVETGGTGEVVRPVVSGAPVVAPVATPVVKS